MLFQALYLHENFGLSNSARLTSVGVFLALKLNIGSVGFIITGTHIISSYQMLK